MRKEREFSSPPRDISEIKDLVPNPTIKTDTGLSHIENLAGMIGISNMHDTVSFYLQYEADNNPPQNLAFHPETSLLVNNTEVTRENALPISRKLMSGLIIHYGLIQNEHFTVPSPDPLHEGPQPPFDSVRWNEGSYTFSRVRTKMQYEKSVALFIDALQKTLPVVTETIIHDKIEIFRNTH
jgi:hypothetical protein